MDGQGFQQNRSTSGVGMTPREGHGASPASKAREAPSAGLPGAADERMADLLAGAVIPRLLVSCRSNQTPRQPTPAHVDTLARLSLSRDPTAAGAQIAALAQSGVRLDSLLHDLIAPAAVRLGEYWHADSADFVEVALAMTRLVAIVRGLGAEAAREVPADAPVALVTTPAIERHALGSLIVAQSFRGAGWQVREVPGADPGQLCRIVATDRVDLVGLSVGSATAAAILPETVSRLRRASRNRRLIVAVGGPAYLADPGILDRAGADFAASDGREAVVRAQELLPRAKDGETIA